MYTPTRENMTSACLDESNVKVKLLLVGVRLAWTLEEPLELYIKSFSRASYARGHMVDQLLIHLNTLNAAINYTGLPTPSCRASRIHFWVAGRIERQCE